MRAPLPFVVVSLCLLALQGTAYRRGRDSLNDTKRLEQNLRELEAKLNDTYGLFTNGGKECASFKGMCSACLKSKGCHYNHLTQDCSAHMDSHSPLAFINNPGGCTMLPAGEHARTFHLVWWGIPNERFQKIIYDGALYYTKAVKKAVGVEAKVKFWTQGFGSDNNLGAFEEKMNTINGLITQNYDIDITGIREILKGADEGVRHHIPDISRIMQTFNHYKMYAAIKDLMFIMLGYAHGGRMLDLSVRLGENPEHNIKNLLQHSPGPLKLPQTAHLGENKHLMSNDLLLHLYCYELRSGSDPLCKNHVIVPSIDIWMVGSNMHSQVMRKTLLTYVSLAKSAKLHEHQKDHVSPRMEGKSAKALHHYYHEIRGAKAHTVLSKHTGGSGSSFVELTSTNATEDSTDMPQGSHKQDNGLKAMVKALEKEKETTKPTTPGKFKTAVLQKVSKLKAALPSHKKEKEAAMHQGMSLNWLLTATMKDESSQHMIPLGRNNLVGVLATSAYKTALYEFTQRKYKKKTPTKKEIFFFQRLYCLYNMKLAEGAVPMITEPLTKHTKFKFQETYPMDYFGGDHPTGTSKVHLGSWRHVHPSAPTHPHPSHQPGHPGHPGHAPHPSVDHSAMDMMKKLGSEVKSEVKAKHPSHPDHPKKKLNLRKGSGGALPDGDVDDDDEDDPSVKKMESELLKIEESNLEKNSYKYVIAHNPSLKAKAPKPKAKAHPGHDGAHQHPPGKHPHPAEKHPHPAGKHPHPAAKHVAEDPLDLNPKPHGDGVKSKKDVVSMKNTLEKLAEHEPKHPSTGHKDDKNKLAEHEPKHGSTGHKDDKKKLAEHEPKHGSTGHKDDKKKKEKKTSR